MKVDNAQNAKFILPPDAPKTKRAGGKKFDEILNSSLKSSGAGDARNASAKTVTASIQKTAPVISPAVEREEIVGRIIKFLDIMDEYATRLGNPSVTLKDISPLISKIENENNQLKLLAESLSPLDEIKPLLDEVLIRSSVEIIKYNRGDYISR